MIVIIEFFGTLFVAGIFVWGVRSALEWVRKRNQQQTQETTENGDKI